VHTILAMVGPKIVRVRCNTCNTDRVFKGTQPLEKAASFAAKKKPSKPRTPKAEKVVISFEDQLKGKNIAGARKYSFRDTYRVDEVLDHPTFGLGLVTAVRDDKVDVTFKAFPKTLAHGKGGGDTSSSKPAYVAPNKGNPRMGDKPPMSDSSIETIAQQQANQE
jgi:hypothetical protein